MDKVKLLWSKTNRWHKGLLIFFIIETRWIPGGNVGFTCNDPALSYEFKGDTITAKHLFGTIFLLPLAVLLLVERTYHNNGKTRHALHWYREYMFGTLVNLIVVQTLKLIVGSPRPHFFDTCGPEEAATCEGSEYVSHYTCTKAYLSAQSNTSFPSGHTSLALHAGLFLIYYLHRRAIRSSTVLGAQIILSLVAISCGLSRMVDHRHHWWDVLAGAIVGLPILVYTVVYLCDNFTEEKELKPNNAKTNGNITDDVLLVDAKET